MGSHSGFTAKINIVQKSKMAAAAILKITFLAIIERICAKFDTEITCQTTQGYKFFSKTANIIYKKLQSINLML